MNVELLELNKKVNAILRERKLPIEIRDTVNSIFQEYKNLYEQYIKEEIEYSEKNIVFRNVDEYFESNSVEAMSRIDNKYREKCEEKAEIITMVLDTFESQKNTDRDDEIDKSEIDVLDKSVINNKENYLYVNNITNIVIDSIENSRSQWFRILEGLSTSEQKKEYIYSQIKLIENSAKLKLGNFKEFLEIDDRQILNEILKEYENYKESRQKNNELEQDEHQKFVNEYKVPEEELQRNARIAEKQAKQVQQDKEYEGGLPGNVLE